MVNPKYFKVSKGEYVIDSIINKIWFVVGWQQYKNHAYIRNCEEYRHETDVYYKLRLAKGQKELSMDDFRTLDACMDVPMRKGPNWLNNPWEEVWSTDFFRTFRPATEMDLKLYL